MRQSLSERDTDVTKRKIEQLRVTGLVMWVDTLSSWDYHPQTLGNEHRKNPSVSTGLS